MRIVCPTLWYPRHVTDTNAVYVHDINRSLVARGHEVTVVTPGSPGAARAESFDGVVVERFAVRLPAHLGYGRVAQSPLGVAERVGRVTAMVRYLRAQYVATLRVARAHRAELLHAHWAIPTGPAAVGAARRLGVPVFITLHGGDVYVNPGEGYDFPTRWYVRPILGWTLRSATGLTAISEDCRAHALRAGARSRDVRVISNGADLTRFSPPAPGPDCRIHGPEMVFACRQLIPRKGIRFLIRAVAAIADRFPELRLVIAGDGFERPALEAQAREQGIAERTTFLGWVPNEKLPPLYRAAAVTVLPSLEEGFGIPAVEAMGCESPVIATDAGGLPEVVEDGSTGVIVPKGDSHALAAALAKLLSDRDLAMRMGRAGRARAVRLFDWSQTAERFERLFGEL